MPPTTSGASVERFICIEPPSQKRPDYGQDLTLYQCKSFGKTRLQQASDFSLNCLCRRGSIHQHNILFFPGEQSVCLGHPGQELAASALDPVVACSAAGPS